MSQIPSPLNFQIGGKLKNGTWGFTMHPKFHIITLKSLHDNTFESFGAKKVKLQEAKLDLRKIEIQFCLQVPTIFGNIK